MDNEYLTVNAVAQNTEFRSLMEMLYIRWSEDAFHYTCDQMMKLFGMECVVVGRREYAFYLHGSRRKRPAFIHVSPKPSDLFDWSRSSVYGCYAVCTVEAGKHDVAREGFEAEVRSEAEDTALLD